MRDKYTQRTQNWAFEHARGVLAALGAVFVFNSLIALAIFMAFRFEDISTWGIYLAGHIVGLSILACLAPWMHAHNTGRMGSLQLFLLVSGALLGCWLARLLVWAAVDLVVMPQIPGSIAAISGILLATIGCGGMYYNSKMRMLRMRQQADQAERASLEADLRSLQAHIEPQLFACALNTIDERIDDNPDAARSLLATLNRYLRGSLRHARTPGTLASELEQLKNYVALSNAGRSEPLTISIDCAPECDLLQFPSMLLQPLVSLSLPERNEPAWLWLCARLDGERLEIYLADRAGRLTQAFRQASSTIEKVRADIEMLFGTAAGLEVCGRSSSDERIVIHIPVAALAPVENPSPLSSRTPAARPLVQLDGGMA